MTEEEKIICKQFLNDADKTHSCNEYRLLMTLLEQETVSKESYDHEYFLRKEFELKIDKLQHQLEQIRAEIVELTKCPYGTECLGANCPSNTDCMICGDHVLEIIDKYKSGSEGT